MKSLSIPKQVLQLAAVSSALVGVQKSLVFISFSCSPFLSLALQIFMENHKKPFTVSWNGSAYRYAFYHLPRISNNTHTYLQSFQPGNMDHKRSLPPPSELEDNTNAMITPVYGINYNLIQFQTYGIYGFDFQRGISNKPFLVQNQKPSVLSHVVTAKDYRAFLTNSLSIFQPPIHSNYSGLL